MEPRARRGDPTKSREENREQSRRAEGWGVREMCEQAGREMCEQAGREMCEYPLEELHLFPLKELHLFPLKELHLLETSPAQSKGFEGWEKANRP